MKRHERPNRLVTANHKHGFRVQCTDRIICHTTAEPKHRSRSIDTPPSSFCVCVCVGPLKPNQDFELRLFARRHAFAGYTRVEPVTSPSVDAANLYGGGGEEHGAEQHGRLEGSVATRHHCIDWNYVGEARPRPNKWRVEMGPGGDVWKEWGFAKVAGSLAVVVVVVVVVAVVDDATFVRVRC